MMDNGQWQHAYTDPRCIPATDEAAFKRAHAQFVAQTVSGEPSPRVARKAQEHAAYVKAVENIIVLLTDEDPDLPPADAAWIARVLCGAGFIKGVKRNVF